MSRFFAALLTAFLIPNTAFPQDAGQQATSMADSINRFGLDLYHVLRGGDGNRFFSPFSISTALAMVREGAGGDTAAEIDKVFHFPSDLARHQSALAKALTPRRVEEYDGSKMRKVPAYQLEIANALWGQEGVPFVPSFLGTLKTEYRAPLERIDFRQSAAARDRINAWVEEKTHDRIKDIVPPPLPLPDTRLALANAIYFKASWADAFSESQTKQGPFFGPGGKTVKVPLMRRIANLNHAEEEAVHVVELPYRGQDTSMILVIPKAKDGLPSLEEKLDHERLNGWFGALKNRKIDLVLPRFKYTVPLELNAMLAQLGMPKAFSARDADFSGMCTAEPLFIGTVLHKAFVAVDEKGTEAAAATVVLMLPGSAPAPEEPLVVRADRPFLFFIRERRTGCILFMGRVTNPS